MTSQTKTLQHFRFVDAVKSQHCGRDTICLLAMAGLVDASTVSPEPSAGYVEAEGDVL
jgi:hypothetical protein